MKGSEQGLVIKKSMGNRNGLFFCNDYDEQSVKIFLLKFVPIVS